MKNKLLFSFFLCLLSMHGIAQTTPINGTLAICLGAKTKLTDATSGGTWSSDNTSVATVVASSGSCTVTAVSAGTSDITYVYGTTTVTATVTVTPMPIYTVSGSNPLCEGGTLALNDATTGGVWSYTNGDYATVGSSSGIVTANDWGYVGSTNITYTVGGCHATYAVTVTAPPTDIQVPGAGECVGITVSISDATSGGTWSLSNTNGSITGTGSVVTLTGVTVGTTTITYTLPTGCFITEPNAIYPGSDPITGNLNVCVNGTTVLADASPVAHWSSSNTAVATSYIGSSSIKGVSSGTATITFLSTLAGNCYSTSVVTVTPDPAAISGTNSVCVGSVITLSDATSGGEWLSSNTSIATVDGSGNVSGVTAGSVSITYGYSNALYSGSECFVTKTITVNSLPGPINGNTGVLCIGSTMSLTDVTTGGTWSSSDLGTGTISTSGVVRGVGTGSGTTTISYTVAGCAATTIVSVSPTVIYGPASLCAGSSVTLTDGAGGGTWTSSNTTVATIGSGTGVLDGWVAGTTTISYMHTSGCVAPPVVVTVYATPAAISGTLTVCQGSVTNLTDATGGGTWSSSNTGIATVDGSGDVTGVSSGSGGTATITYALSTGCSVTAVASVNQSPTISTYLGGPLTVCTGPAFDSYNILLLSDNISGGTWSIGNTSVATQSDVVAGIWVFLGLFPIQGLSVGTSTITYTLSTGCSATVIVTVIPGVAAISGTLTVCTGAVTNLTDSPGGGTWSSSNTSVAQVDASGDVTGEGGGLADIQYILSNGCFYITDVSVSETPTATVMWEAGSGGSPNQFIFSGTPAAVVAYDIYDGSGTLLPCSSQYVTLNGGGNAAVNESDLITLCGAANSVCINNVTLDGCTSYGSAYPTGCAMALSRPAPAANQATQTNESLHIIPNPTNGTFAIIGTLANVTAKEVKIEILDVLSHTILTDNAALNKGSLNENITLGDNIPGGIYLVRVTCGNESQMLRVSLSR